MATRFDASGDYLIRAEAITGLFTIAFWLRLITDANNYTSFLWMGSDTADDAQAIHISTDSDGTRLDIWALDGGAQRITGPQLTVGLDYYIAITGSTAAGFPLRLYVNGTMQGAGTETTGAGTFAAQRFQVADSPWSQPANARVSHLRAWNVDLNHSEIIAEMDRTQPGLENFLWIMCPLERHNDLEDLSGNYRNLTANGTLTTEDDAPNIGDDPDYDLKRLFPLWAVPAVQEPATSASVLVNGGLTRSRMAGRSLAGW